MAMLRAAITTTETATTIKVPTPDIVVQAFALGKTSNERFTEIVRGGYLPLPRGLKGRDFSKKLGQKS